MLKLILGTDWKANTDAVFRCIGRNVSAQKINNILIVPELVSHESERKLSRYCGNTVSRYAQVLSFTRLASRVSEAVGHGVPACMDDGGRLVAMASAAKQLHSKLKVYAAVETKPEFLMGMLDSVDEFKRCCISPADLLAASAKAEGSFAQKLEELSLLLETYNSVCARGKRDPRDRMDWLLVQLQDSDFAQEHTFFVDGFPDFTIQNLEILKHIICNSPDVTISFNCDCVASDNVAFEKAGDTAHKILQIAKRNHIPFEIITVQPLEYPTNPVWENLLQGAVPPVDCVQAYQVKSVHEECTLAADRILDLIELGARYRDIRLVCGNLEEYKIAVQSVFSRCDIPVYLSGKEDVLSKSVVHTVLSALDAVSSGFESKNVLMYLKSALSPLSLSECDVIENYVFTWSVKGTQWLSPWTKHPSGLSAQWTQRTNDELERLNDVKEKAMKPLQKLSDRLRKSVRLSDMVHALYSFLEDICMAQRLDEMAARMQQQGQLRNCQIMNQLWEILLNALEQLEDVLGQTAWEEDTFVRLLKQLLSQYSVGTIPSVLDAVAMGDISTMRCQESEHLILLGASEGSLPRYAAGNGVLTDQERTALRGLGVPLTGGAIDGLQISFSEILATFCGAKKSIFVSCSTEQPSFVFKRVKDMASETNQVPVLLGSTRRSRLEAGVLLVRQSSAIAAEKLGVQDTYDKVAKSREYTLGKLSTETVGKLYGTTLNWSASQIDELAKCRLGYFFKYGLRLKERKTSTLDPIELGNFIHAVLEYVVGKVMELGGFSQVSFDQVTALATEATAAYGKEHLGQLDSDRVAYLFDRISNQLRFVLEEIFEELRASKFAPIAEELAFGQGGQMPAIHIEGKSMAADLGGRVDRIDVWNTDNATFFRVVDYKSGQKSFDYCDILNGIGLQMLLYLFALEDAGADILGDKRVPAGVQYFSATVPTVNTSSDISEEDAKQERIGAWKRKGLLLKDPSVLEAMEPGEDFRRLSCQRNKNGDIVGDVADIKQLKSLKKYIHRYLEALLDDLSSGNVEANPYMRGVNTACRFCPYKPVCNQRELAGARNYQAVKADRFWDDVEKEVSDYGN